MVNLQNKVIYVIKKYYHLPGTCWDGRFNGAPLPSGGYTHNKKSPFARAFFIMRVIHFIILKNPQRVY
jgi:hypothetical protein